MSHFPALRLAVVQSLFAADGCYLELFRLASCTGAEPSLLFSHERHQKFISYTAVAAASYLLILSNVVQVEVHLFHICCIKLNVTVLFWSAAMP